MTHDGILSTVDAFFTAKLAAFGPTHRGVDWNSADGQEMRFAELLRVVDDPGRPFSLLDYGCGYGPLAPYLDRHGFAADYRGFDVSAAMVAQARDLHPGRPFTAAAGELVPADYVVASGLFNVKQDTPADAWQAYMADVVDAFDRLSVRGFAFNALTLYSDADRRRADLYYADPLFWFDRCKRRYARRVALLHDYYPWEFTLVVRKDVG